MIGIPMIALTFLLTSLNYGDGTGIWKLILMKKVNHFIVEKISNYLRKWTPWYFIGKQVNINLPWHLTLTSQKVFRV